MARKRRNVMLNERRKKGKTENQESYSFRIFRYYINGITYENDLIIRLSQISNNVLQMLDDDGNLLLYRAIKHGYYQLALMIWERYPNAAMLQKTWNDRNPLQIAIIEGRNDIARILLTEVSTISNLKDGSGETALFYACYNDQVDLVHLIIQNKCTNINHQDDRGRTALHIACHHRAFKCIKYFLNHTNTIFSIEDTDGNTAFDCYFFWVSKNTEIPDDHLFALFARKYDTIMKQDHKRKYNMIHEYACRRYNNFFGLDHLLDNGYATKMINQQDDNGNTPLHHSCKLAIWNRPVLFRRLLNQPEILVDIKNDHGETPLHVACRYCRLDILQDMIQRSDINFNNIDNNGENAIHHLIHGYIQYNYGVPNKVRSFLGCMNTILTKYPHLVIQQNIANESSFQYACIMHKAVVEVGLVGSYQWRYLQRSYHLHNTYTYDEQKDFWSSLKDTFQKYMTEAKFRMYNFIMRNYIH